jgi:hypothetical protein
MTYSARAIRFSFLFVCCLWASACSAGRDDGGGMMIIPGADAGPDGMVMVPGCDSTRDMDGDGIADAAEGRDTDDMDMDGTPNVRDTDSDGDGTSDADENFGTSGPCVYRDTDTDGRPDFLDSDSDNDGLTDADERNTYHTDPLDRDTDDDMITDLGEAAAMTDPLDPASRIPETDFFVVLPYLDPAQMRTLRFGTSIKVADVYFVIDTTGSMQEPIDNVESSLMRIASEIAVEIPDVQMGVGYFQDFPFRSGFPIGG